MSTILLSQVFPSVVDSIADGDTTNAPSRNAVFDALAFKQPLDSTLTTLAANGWSADAIPIGVGASGMAQTTMTANTFPAKASTGNLEPKTITDFGLSLVAAADASAARTVIGVSSGIYTPTLTNVANITGSVAQDSQWMRVGDVVTVSGRLSIDPTAAGVSTELGISLPIASNFVIEGDCGGTAASPVVASYSAGIGADITNNRAALIFICGADVANRRWNYSFTYLVI